MKANQKLTPTATRVRISHAGMKTSGAFRSVALESVGALKNRETPHDPMMKNTTMAVTSAMRRTDDFPAVP